MKLHGEVIDIPNVKIIPIVRDTGTIILKAAPIRSFEDFAKICPVPEPPVREIPGKGLVPMVDSKEYQLTLEVRNRQLLEYMVIKSLEATEGLTWDSVDMNDPSTYKNYVTELLESGFTQVEITRIVQTVMAANSLDEEAIDRARETFLAGARQIKEQE